ncbi:MAG: right-handed parallel beta-helix repeat-containing protein [Gaiellaceae bacterium]
MSFTLRGRAETRLAAALAPFVVACIAALVLKAWWPIELVGVMLAVGLALDALVYQRWLPYQPGWAAVPLGLVELGATMGLVRLLGIAAPLQPAIWFFVFSWVLAQLFVHALLPYVRLTYAEDAGELGYSGSGLVLAAPLAVLVVLGTAAATQPPTVHLAAGIHEGPIVVDSSQKLVGEPGTVVLNGIVITSDDVVVRDIEVRGGEYGIQVHDSEGVVLEDVSISGALLDGIHARRSSLTVRDCEIEMIGRYTQGIDISFAFDLPPSRVRGCTVVGGQEGIVSHMSHVDFRDNEVRGTTLRAIAVTEMSMGSVRDNVVEDAVGVGIYCGDYSQCKVTDNAVRDTRPDMSSSDRGRHGHAIVAHFGATAQVDDNVLERNQSEMYAYSDGLIRADW